MSENEQAEGDEIVDTADTDAAGEAADKATDDPGNEQISASDELAAALKEAEDAVDERQARRAAADSGQPEGAPIHSADKMTIELLAEELQSLKGEHEKALTNVAETEDKHLRVQAEFDNFRRRTLKEKQDAFKYGSQNLVKDLLATVDNLERAVVHGEGNEDGDFQSLLQGVELVHNELLGILSNHGVAPIEAENKTFDPAVHEAMAQVATTDVPLNTVMQVLQTGYMLRDRMLRPARVIVSKAAEESAEEPTEEPDASQPTQDEATPEQEEQ